jgi:CheY-like chemotaxis protein
MAPDEGIEDLFENAQPVPAVPRPAPKVVLVVDDSPMIRDVVTAVVSQMGHEVRQAANGREALASAMAKAPDLVILDLHMPEMSGLEMLAEMRRLSNLQAVPVVLLTSVRSTLVITKATTYGVHDYLSKPARPARIREKVRKYLR